MRAEELISLLDFHFDSFYTVSLTHHSTGGPHLATIHNNDGFENGRPKI